MILFPLMKGSKATSDLRYVDLLPVNLVPTLHPTQNSSGYMRSFPGIKQKMVTKGRSFGAHYNSVIKSEFRIMGGYLYKDNEEVGLIAGNKLTTLCNSELSTAFIDFDKVKFFKDGEITILKNWSEGEYSKDSPATNFDLSNIIDIDRHLGRYVWINKNSFGCTSLGAGVGGSLNVNAEERPDYRAPFYSTEADPDDNVAIKSWNAYIAVFGKKTTQWFSLNYSPEEIYVSQQSMQTNCGITATHAITEYMGKFAAIGSSNGEKLQIVLISPGEYQVLSTPTIDMVIQKYEESDLSDSLMESLRFKGHHFLIVRLPEETLVYDELSGEWFQLTTKKNDNNNYRAIHFLNNPAVGITVGDAKYGLIGILDDEISSQYDDSTEFIAYTPYVRVNQGRGSVRLFDLRFDSIYGVNDSFESVFISCTVDGISYGNEYPIVYSQPDDYLNKPFISNVGRVYDSIGFRMRVVSKEPVNLSSLTVRIN